MSAMMKQCKVSAASASALLHRPLPLVAGAGSVDGVSEGGVTSLRQCASALLAVYRRRCLLPW